MYEETIPEQQESFLNLDIEMSDRAMHYLRQICNWAAILAYFSGGAIVLGLLIVAVKWWDVEEGFYRAYGRYESIAFVAGALFVLAYAALIGLLFYFARKVKQGLQMYDVAKIESGVSALKIYFMLSAIFGGIYLLLGIVNTVKLFF